MTKPQYIVYLNNLKIEGYQIADLSLLDSFNDTDPLPPNIDDMMINNLLVRYEKRGQKTMKIMDDCRTPNNKSL